MINVWDRKIIIFESEIDSLKTFARRMAEGFEQAGCQVLMADMKDVSLTRERVVAFSEYGRTAALFFNHVGMNLLTADGGSLWNELDVDCYDYIVDHPMYYHAAIIFPIRRLTFLCVDKYHQQFIQRFYQGKVRSFFLPLAGIKADVPEIPFRERSMDILFTGAYLIDDNVMVHTASLGEGLKKIWLECYEMLLSRRYLTLEQAIEECFRRKSFELSDEDLRDMVRLFQDMDGMLRSKMRADVIKTLADHDIKVHIYGEGWECLSCKQENLIIHKRIPFDETIPLMADARIVLNVMPWFKAGVHDRVYSAMLNRAVSLTDGSEYIDQTLLDEENALLFSLDNMDELPDKISWYLGQTDCMEQIAENGYQYAKDSQTWQYRALQLMKIIEES